MTTQDVTSMLLKMKKHVEESKRKESELQGQRKQLMIQLKELGCATLEDGEKYKNELTDLIIASQKDLDEDIATIKSSLGWE